MANKFVWSGAGGSNDGSSWDNAYTTLMRDWGAEGTFTPASDFIYVRSVHSESTAGNLTLTGSTAEGSTAAARIICVVGDTTGTTPGNLATGAAVASTNARIQLAEKFYCYGVDYTSNTEWYLGTSTSTDTEIHLEQCSIINSDTSNGHPHYIGSNSAQVSSLVRLTDCTVTFNAVGQHFRPWAGDFIWDGGTLTNNVTNLFGNVTTNPSYSHIIVRNVDLSALSGNLHDPSGPVIVEAQRCLVHASFSVVDASDIDTPGTKTSAIHCQSSTDADPAYQMEIHDTNGSITATTATYRTGGASDGERTNPISWDMDTTDGSERNYPGNPLESPPIVGWTDGDASTAHTYRIYFASGATQDDDEIWFDLHGPNDAATNSMGVRNTTRVAPETASSAHTTDGSSTWTGADVGTKQYMDISYTPDKPGPISAIVYMVSDAGSTGHIFVDPVIVVDP